MYQCFIYNKYSIKHRRGVEKLASRKAHNLEVGGSSPPPATKN